MAVARITALWEFESRYGPEGDWAQLFRRAPGYHGSELLRDGTVVRAVTDHALSQREFLRLEPPVFAWNPASMRVLEKCGYVREGVLRKSVCKDGEVIDSVVYAKVAP